jgi:hypothetical protein
MTIEKPAPSMESKGVRVQTRLHKNPNWERSIRAIHQTLPDFNLLRHHKILAEYFLAREKAFLEGDYSGITEFHNSHSEEETDPVMPGIIIIRGMFSSSTKKPSGIKR